MLSRDLEVTLNSAFKRARDVRHEYMTVEHLLLGLLDNASAVQVLNACGADLAKLREELEHLKDQARGDGAPNLDAVIAEKQKAYHKSIEKKFKIKHDRGNVLHMYKDDNGIIVYGMANKHWPVPVINSELGAKVIDLAHDSLLNMHLGQRKMLYWVRERYWWKQMRVEIRDHTKTCRTCQKMKFTSSPGYGFMQMKAYDRPGKQICVDIVVLGHKTAKGT